jgi:lysophospholipase L1-like esterase
MRLLAVLIFALPLLFTSAPAPAAPPKAAAQPGAANGSGRPAFIVLPFGDDITQGAQGHDSYRYWLLQRARETGYDVGYAGSQKGTFGGPAAHPAFDPPHEGHWGWTTAAALARIDALAFGCPPYVIINLGLNDLDQPDAAVNNLVKIIDGFRKVNSHVVVIVVQVIPVKGFAEQAATINKGIATIGKLAQSLDSPILTVNLTTGFDPAKLTYDGIHPNEDGEKFIADRIFAALQAVMDHEALIFTHPLTGKLAKFRTFLGIGDYGGITSEIDEMLAGGELDRGEVGDAGDLLLDIAAYATVQRDRVAYLVPQRRYYLAGPILERLARQFRGVSVGHDALDQLAAWQKNPALAKELAAGPLMSQAERARTGQLYPQAYKVYQTVVAKYPGTQAAADAQRYAADLEQRGLAKKN